MSTPDPKHVAYLDMLRELQRQRGERRRQAEREGEQADDVGSSTCDERSPQEPATDAEQPRGACP